MFDAVLSGCLCGLWLYFSITLNRDDRRIGALKPNPAWNTPAVNKSRDIVQYLSWGEAGLFLLSAVLGLSGMFPDSDKDRYIDRTYS